MTTTQSQTSEAFGKRPTERIERYRYDQALETFLATHSSYGPGFSNHGPMAAEALVSMGAEQWIGLFVDAYRPLLDTRPTAHDYDSIGDAADHAIRNDWREWLRAELPELVPAVAAQAGHGLLRVAHAVRGIERAERSGLPVPPVRLRELRAAVGYWRTGGDGLRSPVALVGDRSPSEWLAEFGRLDDAAREGAMLTVTLERAAALPGFTVLVAELGAGDDPTTTFDALALAATFYQLRNDGVADFALLHGVTVSTMARVLLPHLDEAGSRRLEAAVAAFVAAAVIGFDQTGLLPTESEYADRPDPTIADLANAAGATLDDHTIKFTDACLALAARTASSLPLIAAQAQVSATTQT